MTVNFELEFLISLFTLSAIFTLSVYHTNLFFFNRINFLAKYTIYLWIVFIFSALLAFASKYEVPGKLFPYLFTSTTFWLSVWLYFSFIISAIKFEAKKNSFTYILFNNSWLLAIFCIACHTFNHLTTSNTIKPISTIMMLISQLMALTFACTVIWRTFKNKKNFFNTNILIGTAIIVVVNLFSIYFKITGVKIFGLSNASFICIGFFIESIFFSIAISYKLKENDKEKYLALLKIAGRNLVLEKEKKKATEALVIYDQEIKQERDKDMYEQRASIGRELHDNLSSSLISLKYFISDKLERSSSESEQKNLTDIENEVISIYGETRNYSHQLIRDDKTVEVYDIGDYLSKLKKRFSELKLIDINIAFDEKYIKNELSNETTTIIYSFTKECVSNIIKHANASQICISITFDDSHTIIRLKDNGVGFDTEKSPQGMGLKNLKERLRKVNGTISIVSKLGLTEVVGLIPK